MIRITPVLLILHSASISCKYHWTHMHLNRNFSPVVPRLAWGGIGIEGRKSLPHVIPEALRIASTQPHTEELYTHYYIPPNPKSM